MDHCFRKALSQSSARLFILRFSILVAFVTLAGCGGGGGGGESGFLDDSGNAIQIQTTALPQVDQLPYSAAIAVSGGNAPYTWTLVSADGSGMELDQNGVLRASELPVEGVYGITIAVEDQVGRREEQSFSITFAVPALSVISTGLPNAERRAPYTTVLEASGGKNPYRWELLDDGGTGLSLNSLGELSGTIDVLGTYGITVLVTDDFGANATRSLGLEVTEASPLEIDTETLPPAVEGSTYAAVLSASGGTGLYSWRLVSNGGSGLTLTDDGILRGTGPQAGAYGLSVAVVDDLDLVSKSLTLTVSGPESPLEVETTSLEGGVVGRPYADVIVATGGTGAYTWTLINSGGSGLGLSQDGVISGVPSSSGTFGISARVTDGNETIVQSLVVSIVTAALGEEATAGLSISTETLPDITTNIYATVIEASGGTPPYTFAIVEPDPATDNPAGFSINADGALVLSGQFPPPGIYPVTVEVTDAANNTARRPYAVSREGGPVPPVEFLSPVALPDAEQGTFYATVLRVSGGSDGEAAYEFTILNTVPSPIAGLAVESNTGVLTWDSPVLQADDYEITVQVTSDDDTDSAAVRTFTLTVVSP